MTAAASALGAGGRQLEHCIASTPRARQRNRNQGQAAQASLRKISHAIVICLGACCSDNLHVHWLKAALPVHSISLGMPVHTPINSLKTACTACLTRVWMGGSGGHGNLCDESGGGSWRVARWYARRCNTLYCCMYLQLHVLHLHTSVEPIASATSHVSQF